MPTACGGSVQTSENNEIAKADCNAEVVLIPGGCTSLAQPMDKCVDRPFKEAVEEDTEDAEDPTDSDVDDLDPFDDIED